MFSRLLIANRGEIACRIMRTCRRMGIATIAVYSDADPGARHVREADVAARIGPAEARGSYLNVEAIIAAAREHRADAIHPGYGFLSEKLSLVDACNAAGIAFVGPHRDAIARMGSKIESKAIARAAGVTCVPGYDGEDQSVASLTEAAHGIGFPLLIKASAGGGGKGMKRVDRGDEFVAQLAAARREAMAAFADDRVLLERYIAAPRHLEVQLLGDRHGALVHLFERECSIQRNYQKLIEEAPANHLSDATREQLFASALALGRAIGYDSAGTVEFILDAQCDHAPCFLEMNTRLQVEHPVTEMTTGIDLVEWQIRVAAGEELSFAQADIRRQGWAIEARVNAESPAAGFRSSVGKIIAYDAPSISGVRIDSGIDAQSAITPHYDSLLAKVVGFGATRDAAAQRLQAGVRNFRVAGVATNQRLLAGIVDAPAFDEVLTTRFLDEAFPGGFVVAPDVALERRVAAAAAWFFAAQAAATSDEPLIALGGFRVTAHAGRRARYAVRVDSVPAAAPAERRVEIEQLDASTIECRSDGFSARIERRGGDVVCLAANGAHRYTPSFRDDICGLWCEGDYDEWRVRPDVVSAKTHDGAAASVDAIRAELPGVVVEHLVRKGDSVVKGAPVAVMEAMKLFHTLRAPRDCVIATVVAKAGATIAQGSVLFELEPDTLISAPGT